MHSTLKRLVEETWSDKIFNERFRYSLVVDAVPPTMPGDHIVVGGKRLSVSAHCTDSEPALWPVVRQFYPFRLQGSLK